MFLRSLLKSRFVQALALTSAVGMVGATVAPRRAEAIVGLATGNLPAIIVGAGFLAAAGGVAIAGIFDSRKCNGDQYCALASFLAFGGTSILAGLIGLVILDAEDPSSLRFQALSRENQITIGITADEYRVYASELEEINAAWDEGAKQALRAEVQTEAQARGYFEREFAALAPETRTVMAKIAQNALRSAEQQL